MMKCGSEEDLKKLSIRNGADLCFQLLSDQHHWDHVYHQNRQAMYGKEKCYTVSFQHQNRSIILVCPHYKSNQLALYYPEKEDHFGQIAQENRGVGVDFRGDQSADVCPQSDWTAMEQLLCQGQHYPSSVFIDSAGGASLKFPQQWKHWRKNSIPPFTLYKYSIVASFFYPGIAELKAT